MSVGFITVLALDPLFMPGWAEHLGIETVPAPAWRLTIGAALSTIVCASVPRVRHASNNARSAR
jgi:hypothetical protein